MPGETLEVPVRREDRHGKALRHRADQEIHGRTSDPGGPASVELSRGAHMVGREDDLVRKRRQSLTELFELVFVRDPGKDFLPDQPEEDDSPVGDELFPGFDQPSLVAGLRPAGLRRNASDQIVVSTRTLTGPGATSCGRIRRRSRPYPRASECEPASAAG